MKAITFTRNFGQMAAMLAGFKEATGDAVINISADLQDPVELVPQMVEKWQEGAETVICYRTDRNDGLMTKLFSNLAYGILRMSLPQIPQGGFDFVMMDRRVMDEFNAIDELGVDGFEEFENSIAKEVEVGIFLSTPPLFVN